MALLLFEETECTIKQKVAIGDALPAEVVEELAPAAGTLVNTVSASTAVVQSILPSLEELSLLTHVRQVNVEDRELNAAGGDGWFSVVMSNRVPEEGKKYVACLVSLEERWDVVPLLPPAMAQNTFRPIPIPLPVIPLVGESKFVIPQRNIPRMPTSDFPISSAIRSQGLLQ